MSMSAQALVTIDEIKAFLKTKSDEDDAVLEQLGDSVSAEFARYTQRTLMTNVYTSLALDGNGLTDLYLPNWPVTTLTSVYEDETLLTLDADYKVDLANGRLIRLGDYGWSEGTLNIVVTYTAGYTITTSDTRPKDLIVAALKQIGTEYQRFVEKNFIDSSRSLSGQSVQINDDEFAFGVEDVLKRHRRW